MNKKVFILKKGEPAVVIDSLLEDIEEFLRVSFIEQYATEDMPGDKDFAIMRKEFAITLEVASQR